MLDVGRIMKRGRKLLRRRLLRPIDLTILDCLTFSCRGRGRDTACASYNSLARLIGAGRDAVIAGIKRLVAAGMIAKHKQSRLVQWRYGGQAWRQMPNGYRILGAPDCESDFPAAHRELGKSKLALEGISGKFRAQLPIRTVAEQLAILLNGSGTPDSAK